MPDYTEFMMRHGEYGVLAIVEQIERNEGINGRQFELLESRWAALTQLAANDKQGKKTN